MREYVPCVESGNSELLDLRDLATRDNGVSGGERYFALKQSQLFGEHAQVEGYNDDIRQVTELLPKKEPEYVQQSPTIFALLQLHGVCRYARVDGPFNSLGSQSCDK